MPKAPINVRALRAQLQMNQDVFWRRVGITQSGGSRYESGRRLPAPVRMLVDLAYAPVKQSNATLHKLRPDATILVKVS